MSLKGGDWDRDLLTTGWVNPEDLPGYSTFIHWCPEDGCWIATCPELLQLYGDNAKVTAEDPAEAASELAAVVKMLSSDRLRRKKPLPKEDFARRYSGTLTLRMPAWLHERIALSARRERVSINAWIVSWLAEVSERYLR